MNKKDYEYYKNVLLETRVCEREYEVEELLFQKYLSDYLIKKYNISDDDIKILIYYQGGVSILRDLFDCLKGNKYGVCDYSMTRDFITNPLVKEYLELLYTKEELEQMENNLETWIKKEEKAYKKDNKYLQKEAEWLGRTLKEIHNEFYGEEVE